MNEKGMVFFWVELENSRKGEKQHADEVNKINGAKSDNARNFFMVY